MRYIKRLVGYVLRWMAQRRYARSLITFLKNALRRHHSPLFLPLFIEGLFRIRYNSTIEEILDDRLVREPDPRERKRLFEFYIRLLQVTGRYKHGVILAEMAREEGLPIEANEWLASCLSAVGRCSEAITQFRAIAHRRLSTSSRTTLVRSLFAVGDFAGVLAEATKLDTIVGCEFRAYANIYFENWPDAARDLTEKVTHSHDAYRPHSNLAARDPQAYSPTQIDRGLAPDSLLFDNANFLGEHLIHVGRGRESLRAFRTALNAQHRMKASHIPSVEMAFRGARLNLAQLRIFGSEWSTQIGHLGMVDLAFKMRSLGWWSGEPVFLARRHTIANKLLFGLLTEHHTVVYEDGPDPHLWSDLRSLQRLASFPFNVFQREDGDVCSWNEAGALLTRAWKGDHPLRSAFDAWCSSSDRFQAKMRRMTRDLRLDDSKFHVCLHVRDDGFYNDQSQSHRNASLDSYLDIVKIVRERGGVVVRMGAATAPAAPQVPGLIDYAHTRWKSEEMDLYLMRTARCFVGAVSGLSNLAVSLDLPSAFVNSISYDAQMWHSKARFIPKTVYTREGKPLTQRELSSDQWRWHLFSATSMRDAGLRAEGNTNDEIRNIVIELLQDCENPAPVSRSDLTALWEADLCIPHYYGAATPSSYYLQKHSRTFLRDVDPLVV